MEAEKELKMVRELTELQKATVSRRLDALRADFPVAALRLLMEDGTEWKIGEFPAPVVEAPPKKKHTRAKHKYEPGLLQRLCEPWVKLLIENPNEPVRLRQSDFPGVQLDSAQSNIVALAANQVGKGCVTTRTVPDEVEGKAIVAVYHPQMKGARLGPRPKDEAAQAAQATDGSATEQMAQALGLSMNGVNIDASHTPNGVFKNH